MSKLTADELERKADELKAQAKKLRELEKIKNNIAPKALKLLEMLQVSKDDFSSMLDKASNASGKKLRQKDKDDLMFYFKLVRNIQDEPAPQSTSTASTQNAPQGQTPAQNQQHPQNTQNQHQHRQ